MAIDAQSAECELHGMGFARKHAVTGPQGLDDLSFRLPGRRHRRWRTGKSLRVVNAVKNLDANTDYQKGAAYEEALRALDAFLFLVPGSDGTCRAVCDAMAFAVPVVSTRRGILPELLAERRRGEVPGFAVEETPAALGSALVRLLQDDELRAAVGAAALRRTQLDMDPHAAAQRTAALYAELLEERR